MLLPLLATDLQGAEAEVSRQLVLLGGRQAAWTDVRTTRAHEDHDEGGGDEGREWPGPDAAAVFILQVAKSAS